MLSEIPTLSVGQANLGIWMCPGLQGLYGKGRDVTKDVSLIADSGFQRIVALLSLEEVQRFSPRLFEEYADKGLELKHFPVGNMSVPDSQDAYIRTINETVEALESGVSVLTHCMAGLGRAGTFFACVLTRLGDNPDKAIARTRSIRPGAIQTLGQEMFVGNFSEMCAAFDERN